MDKIKEDIVSILAQVNDPEVPVLSVIDLGIVRDIQINGQEIEVMVTPTYSGCPAMDVIRFQIQKALKEHGFKNVKISTQLSPAWTTDWMTEDGRKKLKSYGIAPPNPVQMVCDIRHFHEQEAIQCPLCHSYNTRLISQFGSTPCKALYQCNECQEPFDYFKCH